MPEIGEVDSASRNVSSQGWAKLDQPYRGCGCVWIVIALLVVAFVAFIALTPFFPSYL